MQRGAYYPSSSGAGAGSGSSSVSTDRVFPPGLRKWTRASIAALPPDELAVFKREVDRMALLSAQSQQLKTPLSTVGRLLASDYSMYILSSGSSSSSGGGSIPHSDSGSDSSGSSADSGRRSGGGPLGFVKVGRKCLYVTNQWGMMVQVKPLCVLDIYVYDGLQRRGIGAQLLAMVIQEEGLAGAHELAYDRPSQRMLPFLAKHFGLRDFTPQAQPPPSYYRPLYRPPLQPPPQPHPAAHLAPLPASASNKAPPHGGGHQLPLQYPHQQHKQQYHHHHHHQQQLRAQAF